MIEDIQAAIPLGFFLAFMIGPVFFVLIETSITKGFRAAIALDFGVITADILFIAIAYFSSFQLLENLSNQPGLYVFGGSILTVYGFIIVIKKSTQNQLKELVNREQKTNYLELFFKGFFINFINVGVLVFWLGVILISTPTLDNDFSRFITFFGVMIITYFFTDIIKIVLAKKLQKKLTSSNIIKIKRALGLILVVCGVCLIVKGFLPKDQLNPKIIIEDIRE